MKLRLLLLLSAVVGAAIACGSSDDSALSDSAGEPDAGTLGKTGPTAIGDGGATAQASGVLLVHAAAFPAFRLCFENYPDILAQPDSKVLPEANVVGVEMGGVVRIGPMTKAPGKVYVIRQKFSPARPNDASEKNCGKLIGELDLNDMQPAGEITRPVGVNDAEVIAITGCGGATLLTILGVDSSKDCGNYDQKAQGQGNLTNLVFPLDTTNTTTESTLPVQLISLAPKLDALKPADDVIDVSFGALTGGDGGAPDQTVAHGLELYDASAPVTLNLDQTKIATFGQFGFRVGYRPSGDAGAADGGFSVDQTLAQVQENSKPSANPTSYFLTNSNYALLLLGDPTVTPTFVDGGPNTAYDARRAVHLLAIPVRDEVNALPLGVVDAGADTAADGG